MLVAVLLVIVWARLNVVDALQTTGVAVGLGVTVGIGVNVGVGVSAMT